MLAVFLGTLIMCMTYQAASGIYVLSIIFLMALHWNNGLTSKQCFKKLTYSLSAYIIAMLFYRIAIMKVVDDYASSSIIGDKSILGGIVRMYGLLSVPRFAYAF